MFAERSVTRFLLTIVLCICVIVGAQALAAASAPSTVTLSQSRVVGAAGFAYLGGLRVFAAGLLYSRLDPQFHQFGKPDAMNRLDLLPAIRLIQALNPQLEMSYYFVSYVLEYRGMKGQALQVAKDGIANNPNSGLLHANYAQILMMQDRKRNLQLMIEQARVGLGPNATYSSIDNQFWSYGVFKTIAHLAGDTKAEQAINAEQQHLRSLGATGSTSSGGTGFGGLLQSWQNSATDSSNE